MGKRYLALNRWGGLSITVIPEDDPVGFDGFWLTKVLFELSRTTDMPTHFDFEIHTREAIAAGLDGHRPLALLAEIDHTELPSDRYFRDAWEWSDS